VVADPSLIGQTVRLTIPASDPFDQPRGVISRDVPRRSDGSAIMIVDHQLVLTRVTKPFNWVRSSTMSFELAGPSGAIVGTFYDPGHVPISFHGTPLISGGIARKIR
jgi:phosphate transport system permease protein